MKRRSCLPRALASLIVVALCAACACCGRGSTSHGVVRIIPKPIDGSSPGTNAPAVDHKASTTQQPRISLDPAYTVIQVVNQDIDGDDDEEQLIAVKKMDDVSAPVHLIVADVDPERGTYYYQSWESDTNATDSRAFSLSLMDVMGDHSMQIVASGVNEAGELTCDLFKAQPPALGKGLTFRPICQLVADDIVIQEQERADTYPTDKTPGASFPIDVTLKDPDSASLLDMVSIRYTWNAAEGRYVPGQAVKKPADQVQQAQLHSLFSRPGEEAFIQFLSGSWIQVSTPTNGKAKESIVSLLDFDPLNKKISLSSGSTEEAYLWRDSYRTAPNRLMVIGENETVLQIQLNRTFSITAESSTSITVTISGTDTSETSTAVYMKVSDEIRTQLMERPDAQAALSTLSLTGAYTGSGGASVDFQSPRVIWSDASGSRSGSFILFSLGSSTVMTVRYVNKD